LLNDQSGAVLGDSTVFSWVGCHIGDVAGCSKTISSFQGEVISRPANNNNSSSKSNSEAPGDGVFISSESPSVAARGLMSSNTRIFKDLMRKVLQFYSDDREYIYCKRLDIASSFLLRMKS
jgi:hypothetical protein